jgi:hypothetical protein
MRIIFFPQASGTRPTIGARRRGVERGVTAQLDRTSS